MLFYAVLCCFEAVSYCFCTVLHRFMLFSKLKMMSLIGGGREERRGEKEERRRRSRSEEGQFSFLCRNEDCDDRN